MLLDKKLRYGPKTTRLDALKAFAVIFMIIDHIGAFFFPENLWWRAVGRWSVPIWLFIIGLPSDLRPKPILWAGAGIMQLNKLVFFGAFFPANMLLSIALWRQFLSRLPLQIMLRSWLLPVLLLPLIFFLHFPSSLIVEYGVLGLVLGLWAQQRHVGAAPELVNATGIVAGLYFLLSQIMDFGFSNDQALLMLVGCIPGLLLLHHYQPGQLGVNFWGAGLVRLLGRRSLEIYVLHLCLFSAICYFMGWKTAYAVTDSYLLEYIQGLF